MRGEPIPRAVRDWRKFLASGVTFNDTFARVSGLPALVNKLRRDQG